MRGGLGVLRAASPGGTSRLCGIALASLVGLAPAIGAVTVQLPAGWTTTEFLFVGASEAPSARPSMGGATRST